MENKKHIPQDEESLNSEGKVKSPWQLQKESWYDKIPLNLKQLDAIIGICLVLLALTFIAICMDAMGIYNFFG